MPKEEPQKQESEDSNGSEADIFQSVFVSKSSSGMVQIGSEKNNQFHCETEVPKNLGTLVEATRIEAIKKESDDESRINPDDGQRRIAVDRQSNFRYAMENVFIEVTVTEPKKIGEGMSSYMAYSLKTKTNSGYFTKSDSVVARRFSDFLGLHGKLREKYAPLGRIVPPAPDKNIVSTTKAKIVGNGASGGGVESLSPLTGSNSAISCHGNNVNGGQSYASSINSPSSDFIHRRRLALERFVNRIAGHPVLNRDPEFIDFLENPRELPRATSTSALSSASVFRLLGRVGDTMNKMTYKIIEETDPWFLENVRHIDNLETQLKKLYSCVESLINCRQELAQASGQFSAAMALLAQAEEAHSLSRALSHLAKVEEKVEAVHYSQAEADIFYLFELLKDYVGLVGAIKEALHERDKAFQAWQQAQSMVIKKKEQRARAEMSGRLEKIPSANEEVLEWESRCEENQSHFQNVSSIIKVEIAFFERYRVKDFKISVVRYVEALHSAQCQLLKHWEEFLPEVKSILF